jgi:hypothetical protein
MKLSWGIITLFSVIAICAYFSFPGLRISLFKSSTHKKFYSLSVKLDSDSAYYLDSVSISANYLRSRRVYDTTGVYDYIFVFDSVEAGPLSLRLESQLDTSFSKELVLDKDSIIHISRSDLPQFTEVDLDSMNFTALIPGEKICVAMASRGCFHYFTEKTVIRRRKDLFTYDFFSIRNRFMDQFNDDPPYRSGYVSGKFDIFLQDSLKKFHSSLQEIRKAGEGKIKNSYLTKDGEIVIVREMRVGSTTTSWYRIQKGKYVCTITDGSGEYSKGYASILKMIRPDWFKENAQ